MDGILVDQFLRRSKSELLLQCRPFIALSHLIHPSIHPSIHPTAGPPTLASSSFRQWIDTVRLRFAGQYGSVSVPSPSPSARTWLPSSASTAAGNANPLLLPGLPPALLSTRTFVRHQSQVYLSSHRVESSLVEQN